MVSLRFEHPFVKILVPLKKKRKEKRKRKKERKNNIRRGRGERRCVQFWMIWLETKCREKNNYVLLRTHTQICWILIIKRKMIFEDFLFKYSGCRRLNSSKRWYFSYYGTSCSLPPSFFFFPYRENTTGNILVYVSACQIGGCACAVLKRKHHAHVCRQFPRIVDFPHENSHRKTTFFVVVCDHGCNLPTF